MTEENAAIARLRNLRQLWFPEDPQGSERALKELLPVAESLSGEDRFLAVQLQVRIARCEMAQQKFAEARLSLATAEKLLETCPPAQNASTRIQWLVEMGRLHVLQKTPSQARTCLAEAWTLALRASEAALAVETALLLAAIEPPKQQQEWIQRGIQIADGSEQPDAKRWLGELHVALGWKYFDLRQYEPALAAFKKSLVYLTKEGTRREKFVAQWAIGKLERTLGRTEEALAIQNALLTELGVSDFKDGRVYQELAECLHSLKRAPEAQVYFDLAYRALSSDAWVVDNEPDVLKRLKDLGKSKN